MYRHWYKKGQELKMKEEKDKVTLFHNNVALFKTKIVLYIYLRRKLYFLSENYTV